MQLMSGMGRTRVTVSTSRMPAPKVSLRREIGHWLPSDAIARATTGEGGRRTLLNPAHRGIIAPMSDTYHKASEAAQRAHDLLAQPATLDSYDWLLLATLLVEADEALERAKKSDPAVELPLLDEVVEELRDATANFTKPDFVRATKPARRQRPSLFSR